MKRTKSWLKKAIKSIWIMALFFTLCCSVPAEAATKSKKKKTRSKPRAHRVVSSAASPARYADLVIDATTGRILHETNSQAIRHPASLTKMMTLYLTFQAIEAGRMRLDTLLPVSAYAASQPPSKLGLKAGQTIRAYDAIMGLITESANDAAVVLAEGISGNTRAFAERMVRQARALGMRQTVFQNPNGLPDPNQITTARDMAMLGYGLIYHFPGFYPYFSRNSFTCKGRVHNNHNNLMKRYDGMDGIKTGYIRASGFNIVTSATRGQTRLIGVVFGGTSAAARDRAMESLLNEAFENRAAQSFAQAERLEFPTKAGGSYTTASRQPRTADTRAPTVFGEDVFAEGSVQSGAWGIQVGAYSDVEAAQKALAGMASSMVTVLADAEQSLQKITMTDGSVMYRARFMGLDQQAARAACSHLVRRGQGCLVVAEP